MNIFIDHEIKEPMDSNLLEIIKQAVLATIKSEPCPYEVDLNITIVDESTIKEVNLETRGKDTVTDVLSFPLIEFEKPCDFELIELQDDAFNMDTGDLYLGDMMICFNRAIEQAKDYNHSLEREIGFLTVHSMLHLLGYDHMEPWEESIMLSHQKDILEEMGLKR